MRGLLAVLRAVRGDGQVIKKEIPEAEDTMEAQVVGNMATACSRSLAC